MDFVYAANPSRVVFGTGTIERLGDEAERLGLERLLIVSTADQTDQAHLVASQLGARAAEMFANAVMHTPVEVTERAMSVVGDARVDGIVAVGGGSAIGLGKALAMRTDLPQIAVPTTYAGSEMTPILGETKDGAKVTQSDSRVLPEVVVYDVDLTLSLPPRLSGTSGLNAIAHAVEALYARDRNPIVSLMALEGIGALTQALPGIMDNPDDRGARAKALYGAWLCGTCLGAVGMAIHHKLCHTLGGSFNLPHSETHTIVLPHALAYNLPAVPEVKAQLEGVLGPDPARALYELAGTVGAARGLKDLGMLGTAINEATERALANPYWNPRALESAPICALITRAWNGEPPQSD
ncbi:maleylacetate reductase [Sphingomonas ginsenosidivorax]|uniref:Maleylacetate reductase n=1 Tax=Sphingomonas ginsenosidivorax TaxID=862135 RepID=A0A5C6U780_9SPHN|nr:maleylacetate reductase [Sphingomonas ginsenosidivorax]TXC67981.1 maleylacetate reductase [Sphingomonas ginsenosidivorax]